MSRLGLKSLAAGFLLAASGCSSAAFQPAQGIVHRPGDRSVSTTPLPSQRVVLDVALTPLADPRISLPDGRLAVPRQAELEAWELWLRSGQRADPRFLDFIAYSACTEYAWWDSGGGIRLALPPGADAVLLASRWVRWFPDVVAEAYSRPPCRETDPQAQRRVSTNSLADWPAYSVYHRYDDGAPPCSPAAPPCMHGSYDCRICGSGDAWPPVCDKPLVVRPRPQQHPAGVGQPLGPLARPPQAADRGPSPGP